MRLPCLGSLQGETISAALSEILRYARALIVRDTKVQLRAWKTFSAIVTVYGSGKTQRNPYPYVFTTALTEP